MINTENKWLRFALTAVVAVILVFALVFEISIPLPVFQTAPVVPDVSSEAAVRERIGFDSRYDSYLFNGADLYVYSDDHSTQKAKIDGDTGALTLAGLLYPSFADLTVTDGLIITPTVTVYALDTAGNVTMTLGASGVEGQILILIGDDNNTITIADTNIRSSDGNAITMGQYDVRMFVYQDNEWILVSTVNNS